MIAEAIRRSPLAEYAERFAALYEKTNGAISIRELPFLTQINLRVDPKATDVIGQLAEGLGFDLPMTPNTVATSGDLRALWLGPDEWLIVGAADQARRVKHSLRNAVSGATASIVDVSADRTVLLIGGDRALELLAQAIAIDLHSNAFRLGQCAQTLFSKSPAIIERLDGDRGFRLFVRSSFASYVADWLLGADM